MKLTAENVDSVFMKCLFKEGEPTDNHVIAEGVIHKIGFHPDRVKENEGNIISMLNDLPDSFKQSVGGGMSFLNACLTSEGEQWGEHSNIDQLVCLGLAIKKVSIPFPRDVWTALPGGMPYFVVLDKEVEKS